MHEKVEFLQPLLFKIKTQKSVESLLNQFFLYRYNNIFRRGMNACVHMKWKTFEDSDCHQACTLQVFTADCCNKGFLSFHLSGKHSLLRLRSISPMAIAIPPSPPVAMPGQHLATLVGKDRNRLFRIPPMVIGGQPVENL